MVFLVTLRVIALVQNLQSIIVITMVKRPMMKCQSQLIVCPMLITLMVEVVKTLVIKVVIPTEEPSRARASLPLLKKIQS